jgi:hypothetical protein
MGWENPSSDLLKNVSIMLRPKASVIVEALKKMKRFL